MNLSLKKGIYVGSEIASVLTWGVCKNFRHWLEESYTAPALELKKEEPQCRSNLVANDPVNVAVTHSVWLACLRNCRTVKVRQRAGLGGAGMGKLTLLFQWLTSEAFVLFLIASISSVLQMMGAFPTRVHRDKIRLWQSNVCSTLRIHYFSTRFDGSSL